MKPLNVGFYSLHNPYDRTAWSGIIYSMYNALRSQGVEFTNFGDHCVPPKKRTLVDKVTDKIGDIATKIIGGTESVDDRFASYARQVHAAVMESDCDLIFAPVASGEVHHLYQLEKPKAPLIYLSDVTFDDLNKLYRPGYSDEEVSLRDLYETTSLRNADAIVYPTEWSVTSAVERYKVPEEKIRVMPYGANIPAAPAKSKLTQKLGASRLRLLFIGLDWERKGGPVVAEAFRILLEKGLDVEFYILGCNPELEFESEHIHVFPFLNKNIKEERDKFHEILLNSHFLLFPTRADTFGIVNCEANANGIPVIASDCGGVPHVIREGVNGHVLPLSATGADYAEVIARYLDPKGGLNREVYEPLMLTARKEYDTRLNWEAWGRSMHSLMQEMVAGERA